MKRIYTTLALLGALVTGAFAQKTVDLSITAFYPVSGTTYPNVATGDSFLLAGILKNNGTEAIGLKDTVTIHYGGFAQDNSNFYDITSRYYGLSLAAGASDTVGSYFTQGEDWGAGDDGEVKTVFPTNSNDTLDIYVTGVDSAGVPFDDAGIIANGSANGSDSIDVGGTNNIIFYEITFGSVTSINNVKLAKTNLTVYPNPALNSITVRNDFKTGSKTSSLTVSDIAGRIVKIITLGQQTSGVKNFDVDVTDLNSGSYYIQLVTDETRGVAKFTKK